VARNENTSWPNRHTIYLAASGGGKSSAMKANPDLPKRGGRLLAWDPDRDHWCYHLDSMRAFLYNVRRAAASGKPFRLGYNGPDTPEAFEQFCGIVWAVLDGEHATDVIIEELADVCVTIGKAGPQFGRLLRKGRKYGARLHITSQRPQEIPKTAVGNCGVKFIGRADTPDDAKALSRYAAVGQAEIEALQPLQFYVKEAGNLTPTLVDLRRATARRAAKPPPQEEPPPENGNLKVPEEEAPPADA
jgi:hypothetical protein